MSEYTIQYYSERIKAAIAELPKDIFDTYVELTARMQQLGPNLGMPHTKALGSGLFEIRAEGAGGWGRVFYCALKGKRIVMLHSMEKKSNATPQRELETARRRMQEIKNETIHPIE